MFLGITIHFVKTNLFQIIMHVTSVIYMTWSIYARWPVDYYWALVSILGFLPWILDISLLYWSVLRYRPGGIRIKSYIIGILNMNENVIFVTSHVISETENR